MIQMKNYYRELYQVLIYNYSNDILLNQTYGFLNLIINNDHQNVSQIYRLFLNNYNLLNDINGIFDKVIDNSLSEIINEFKFEKKVNYKKLIEDTINIYDKYNCIIKECFDGNNIYQLTLSQQLNKYFDTIIKDEAIYSYLVLFINDTILNEKINEELFK